jgi:hypothetical protein
MEAKMMEEKMMEAKMMEAKMMEAKMMEAKMMEPKAKESDDVGSARLPVARAPPQSRFAAMLEKERARSKDLEEELASMRLMQGRPEEQVEAAFEAVLPPQEQIEERFVEERTPKPTASPRPSESRGETKANRIRVHRSGSITIESKAHAQRGADDVKWPRGTVQLPAPSAPHPHSEAWEQVSSLMGKLPVYSRATVLTSSSSSASAAAAAAAAPGGGHSSSTDLDAARRLMALQSVATVLVTPLLAGSRFLLGRSRGGAGGGISSTSTSSGRECTLRLDSSSTMLHWSVDHRSGLFRGSLLLRNVVQIDVAQTPPAFTLHVWQGKGRAGSPENPVPARLTFEASSAAVVETWVAGLKFVRDVQPVAGVVRQQAVGAVARAGF